ncbi:hypothetical protein [Herbaspirillum sp. SJZ107]|uniref:hypothetical protein n=1 Tax=Herbaspirillum sp. SJZ107 TaxID=2572881 RepID=UPI002107309B|nr:hypothetical protein [Herbaspirillum sp. SJZ107]
MDTSKLAVWVLATAVPVVPAAMAMMAALRTILRNADANMFELLIRYVVNCRTTTMPQLNQIGKYEIENFSK